MAGPWFLNSGSLSALIQLGFFYIMLQVPGMLRVPGTCNIPPETLYKNWQYSCNNVDGLVDFFGCDC